MVRDVVVRGGNGLMKLICPSCSAISDAKVSRRSLPVVVRRGQVRLGGLLTPCRTISTLRLCPARFRGAPGGDVGHCLCDGC